MRFNRNVITATDIANFKSPAVLVPALDRAPPSGVHPVIADLHPGAEKAAAQTVPGGVTVPSGDDYMTKLLKYVPAEILGFYLFADSLIRSNTAGTPRAVWLGVAAIVALTFTAIYDRVTLEVVRSLQIAVSVVGVAVYIFTVGGWFATTSWYHSWYASFALGAFAVIAGMVKLPPLPTEPNPEQPGAAPGQQPLAAAGVAAGIGQVPKQAVANGQQPAAGPQPNAPGKPVKVQGQ